MQGGYQNNNNYRSGGGYRGGRHGGGRHGGGGKEGPWYETVKSDRSVQERPGWNLTSYGHTREGENDVCGDISPEEVRYANMMSMQQGIRHQALGDQFRKANRQRIDLFQGLTKSRQAPSIEGRPIMAPMNSIDNMTWLHSSAQGGTFGSAGQSSFGRGFGGGGIFSNSSTTTAGSGGFGSTTTAGSGGFGGTSTTTGGGGFGGTSTTSGGGFGSTTPTTGGGGFGGGFGGTSTTSTGGFSTTFTSTTAQPFGSQQHHGFGSLNQSQAPTQGSQSVFGQQATTQQPFGQQAGAPAVPTGVTSQQHQMSPPPEVPEEESRLWMTESFEKGSIPTHPPPPHVC